MSWKRGLGLRSILGHCAVPSGLGTPKRPLGWGRKNSGAIRRFFPKARGFAAQDNHCQAGALRRAATVRVPLDGVRWTEAPRGRPCPGQGARAGGQDRSSPPTSCGPPVLRRPGSDRRRRGPAADSSSPGPPSRSGLAGGPPGSLSPPSPPPWPYRSWNLSEFPVSPHLGREPSSRRSSGNTLGLRRFSRNKETDRQLSVLLVPQKKTRTPAPQLRAAEGRWSRSRLWPRGRPRGTLYSDQ